MTGEDYTLGGEHTVRCTDDVLQNGTLNLYNFISQCNANKSMETFYFIFYYIQCITLNFILVFRLFYKIQIQINIHKYKWLRGINKSGEIKIMYPIFNLNRIL